MHVIRDAHPAKKVVNPWPLFGSSNGGATLQRGYSAVR